MDKCLRVAGYREDAERRSESDPRSGGASRTAGDTGFLAGNTSRCSCCIRKPAATDYEHFFPAWMARVAVSGET